MSEISCAQPLIKRIGFYQVSDKRFHQIVEFKVPQFFFERVHQKIFAHDAKAEQQTTKSSGRKSHWKKSLYFIALPYLHSKQKYKNLR